MSQDQRYILYIHDLIKFTTGYRVDINSLILQISKLSIKEIKQLVLKQKEVEMSAF